MAATLSVLFVILLAAALFFAIRTAVRQRRSGERAQYLANRATSDRLLAEEHPLDTFARRDAEREARDRDLADAP